MEQIELNTPFNLRLNMNNDIISRSNNNFHENSLENELKLFKSKIKNRSRLIKVNSINDEQLNTDFKNNKCKFLIFLINNLYFYSFSSLRF